MLPFPELLTGYVLPCLYTFLACVGFTLVFNIHGVGKLICATGGALGWLIYLLAGETIFAGFLAAAAIGTYSEIMARIRRCPVTCYLLVALLPLVPGGGVYRAMKSCVEGEIQEFLNTLLYTFGMAAALAVGAMMAASLFRAVYPYLQRQQARKSRQSGTSHDMPKD